MSGFDIGADELAGTATLPAPPATATGAAVDRLSANATVARASATAILFAAATTGPHPYQGHPWARPVLQSLQL